MGPPGDGRMGPPQGCLLSSRSSPSIACSVPQALPWSQEPLGCQPQPLNSPGVSTWLDPGHIEQVLGSPQDLMLQACFRDAHLRANRDKQTRAEGRDPALLH